MLCTETSTTAHRGHWIVRSMTWSIDKLMRWPLARGSQLRLQDEKDRAAHTALCIPRDPGRIGLALLDNHRRHASHRNQTSRIHQYQHQIRISTPAHFGINISHLTADDSNATLQYHNPAGIQAPSTFGRSAVLSPETNSICLRSVESHSCIPMSPLVGPKGPLSRGSLCRC